MPSMPITKARASLYALVTRLQEGEDPVVITGKNGNAVLVSEDDWRSIEETLYLLSIPGMRTSIRTGLRTPVSQCAKNIDL